MGPAKMGLCLAFSSQAVCHDILKQKQWLMGAVSVEAENIAGQIAPMKPGLNPVGALMAARSGHPERNEEDGAECGTKTRTSFSARTGALAGKICRHDLVCAGIAGCAWRRHLAKF